MWIPKTATHLNEVRSNIEHATVVVAHKPHARMTERSRYFGGLHPGLDLSPALRIVVQHSGGLKERNAQAELSHWQSRVRGRHYSTLAIRLSSRCGHPYC